MEQGFGICAKLGFNLVASGRGGLAKKREGREDVCGKLLVFLPFLGVFGERNSVLLGLVVNHLVGGGSDDFRLGELERGSSGRGYDLNVCAALARENGVNKIAEILEAFGFGYAAQGINGLGFLVLFYGSDLDRAENFYRIGIVIAARGLELDRGLVLCFVIGGGDAFSDIGCVVGRLFFPWA